MKHHNLDIFSHNMLLMPYQSGRQYSLFVVLGANNVKDYMRRSFTGTTPCILHILPYATSNRSQLHAYNQVSFRIRAWLNALWRNSQCNNDYMSMPFTHRSMPMSRPFGKLSFHDILSMHKQINRFMQNMYLSVHFPTQTTDAGLCLLKYAHLLASTDISDLNNKSFDADGHENILGQKGSSSVSSDAMHRFRLDFLKLICEVTCKFHTVKKASFRGNGQCGCITDCDCPTNANNGCDVEWDDNSVDSSHTSMSCGSSVSDHSDSTYCCAAGEDDELDDSSDMYNAETPANDDVPNHTSAPHGNTPGHQKHSKDHTDGEDDDSTVEEMYSDFKEDYRQSKNNSNHDCDDFETDNLVSPGDVLEYCTIDRDQTARRCSVETIIDSDHESYLILKNGTVLRPKTHSVRKIKFYDEYNKELIPNPLAEWHRLDKCILQPGSMNGDDVCFGDEGDDDGSEDGTDEMDAIEVQRVREQRRRQNKQRYGF